MTEKLLIDIFGIFLVITGFFDAYKYHWQCNAIRKVGLARGHSRKFINAAMLNDVIRFTYLILKPDIFLLSACVIAIVYMAELWFTIYKYYPYRYRGLYHFKRPNVFTYLLNSILPNAYRRRL
jgi:Ca2+/H+ antiporter